MVRRIGRWLLNTLTIASLVLCLVASGLWALSYHTAAAVSNNWYLPSRVPPPATLPAGYEIPYPGRSRLQGEPVHNYTCFINRGIIGFMSSDQIRPPGLKWSYSTYDTFVNRVGARAWNKFGVVCESIGCAKWILDANGHSVPSIKPNNIFILKFISRDVVVPTTQPVPEYYNIPPNWGWLELDVPIWYLVIQFALIPVWRFAITLLRRKARRPGHCPICGYDMRATPDRCPECGTIADKREVST